MRQHQVWLAVGFAVEATSRQEAKARAAQWLHALLRDQNTAENKGGLTVRPTPYDLDEAVVPVLQQKAQT